MLLLSRNFLLGVSLAITLRPSCTFAQSQRQLRDSQSGTSILNWDLAEGSGGIMKLCDFRIVDDECWLKMDGRSASLSCVR